MANLHFHYGVMSSSKSAALIINAHNFTKNGTQTEVIKPSFDTRFGKQKIVSRIGLEWDAMTMPNLQTYTPAPDTRVILVDEVQFFSPSDIDKLVHIADNHGRIVMCYGLMTDSNEKIFPASQRLIEVGAKLHRMESNCQINGCMKMATHHLRFDADGKVIHAGDQFALGDSNYKSVCRHHYNELYHNKQKTR
ncbi:MAG: thymidine kinase [Alphaproteobacteria bacterium]|nr:thymidine kinase [Alphaproteobacteria bacterium]